jgi:uncharacterized lipoprotein
MLTAEDLEGIERLKVKLQAAEQREKALRAADAPLARALFTVGRLLDDLGLSVTDRQRVEYMRREIRAARALLSPQPAEQASDSREEPPEGDDRYDAAHPESEHDGGLGSGNWMGSWEDRR